MLNGSREDSAMVLRDTFKVDKGTHACNMYKNDIYANYYIRIFMWFESKSSNECCTVKLRSKLMGVKNIRQKRQFAPVPHSPLPLLID